MTVLILAVLSLKEVFAPVVVGVPLTYSVPVGLPDLRTLGWHQLTATWDSDAGTCVLAVDDAVKLKRSMSSVLRFGLSYLHLQTLAEENDPQGSYFRCFEMKGL